MVISVVVNCVVSKQMFKCGQSKVILGIQVPRNSSVRSHLNV